MKRFHSFLSAAVLAASMLLVPSCGPGTGTGTNTVDPKYEQATKIEVVSFIYGNEVYVEGARTYMMSANAESLELTETPEGLVPSGTGDFLNIEFDVPMSGDGSFPAAGKYPVRDSEKDGRAAGYTVAGWLYDVLAEYGMPGVYLMPYGTYVTPVESDVIAEEQLLVVGGYIEVKGDAKEGEIYLEAKLNNGETRTYYFKGAATAEDQTPPPAPPFDPFEYEPDQATTIQAALDTSWIQDYGDYFENNTTDMYLELASSDGRYYLVGEFFTAPNENVNTVEQLYGTYTVASTLAAGTLRKSEGVDEASGYATETYLQVADAAGNLEAVYFVTAGTMTIEEGKMTLNLTTQKGSTLNLTLEKSIQIINSRGGGAAPAVRTRGISKLGKGMAFRPLSFSRPR